MNSQTVEFFVEYYTGTFPQDDYTAVCIAKRVDVGMDYDPELSLDQLRKMGLFVNTFSVADAKQAGLWKKSGTWTTNPKRMLKMRARAFTLRDGWPDVLKGLHSIEEIQDGSVVTLAETKKGHYSAPTPEKPKNRAPDEGKLGAGLSKYTAQKTCPAWMKPVEEKEIVPMGPAVDARTEEMAPEQKGKQSAKEMIEEKNRENENKKDENWWHNDKHWKFRRGEDILVQILTDNFMDYMRADEDVKLAYKNKFIRSQGENKWYRTINVLMGGEPAADNPEDVKQTGSVPNGRYDDGDPGPVPDEEQAMNEGPSLEEQEEIRRKELLDEIMKYPKTEIEAAQTRLGQEVGFQPKGLGGVVKLLRELESGAGESGRPDEDVKSPLDQLEELKNASEANLAHYNVAINKIGDPQTAEDCMAIIHFINQRIAMQAEKY